MFAGKDWLDFVAILAMGMAMGSTLCIICWSLYSGGALRRKAVIDAYAGWLAARLTLSRTTLSFVASFRALGAEPRDSAYYALRTNEAQRARQDWCDGMQALDRAEAEIIAWSKDADICTRLAQFVRNSSDLIRRAIDPDSDGITGLIDHFRKTDRDAIRFVRARVKVSPFGRIKSFLRTFVGRSGEAVGKIVERWSRPS